MTTMETLREKPIPQLFFSYLIPSILGMMLMAVNIVIDGIMISRGVGPNGLAGVNVAGPAFSIFFSISLWIGIGGGTLYSIKLGQNQIDQARSIFSQSMTLAIVIVGILILICLWKIEELAYLFGANDVILPYTVDYLQILLLFGIIYVLENVLSTFIRNDGNPTLAMSGLIVTSILNIILDYIFIFIFHWGVKGAASATIISAAIGFLVLLSHFFRKNSILKFTRLHFHFHTIKQILNIGFPSFVGEISMAIVTIGFNIAFITYAGEMGVAAFAIVNSIHALMLLAFFGVGGALQPIASFHYGARLVERLKASLRLTVGTALTLGVVALIIGSLFANYLVMLFGVESAELKSLTIKGMAIFFIHYLFLGYNIVYAEYFQSIQQIKKSVLIIMSRGLVLVIALLLILPPFLGLTGIWLVLPIAEGITAIAVFMMNRRMNPIPSFEKLPVQNN